MDKEFLYAQLKKTGEKIEFIASDETLDRQGEVIPIESWDLKNFKKNPVLIVNHDYKVQNIVGRAKNLRMDGKTLVFEPMFHELTQLAKEVKAMVEEGMLNTVSVGFMPIWPKKDGEKVKNELLEISFVPVPANPSASRISKALEDQAEKGIEPEAEDQIKSFLEESEEPAEEEKEVKAISDKTGYDQVKEAETVLVAGSFLKELIDDSEKLKILTGSSNEKSKGRASKKAQAPREVRILRSLAKELNKALYDAKRNY